MYAARTPWDRSAAVVALIVIINVVSATLIWLAVSNHLAMGAHRDDLDLIAHRLVRLEPLRAQAEALGQQPGSSALPVGSVVEARALAQSRLRRLVQDAGGSLLSLTDEPSGVSANPEIQELTATLRLKVEAERVYRFAQNLEALPGSGVLKVTITPLRDDAASVDLRLTVTTRVRLTR